MNFKMDLELKKHTYPKNLQPIHIKEPKIMLGGCSFNWSASIGSRFQLVMFKNPNLMNKNRESFYNVMNSFRRSLNNSLKEF